jgi:pectate lyase
MQRRARASESTRSKSDPDSPPYPTHNCMNRRSRLLCTAALLLLSVAACSDDSPSADAGVGTAGNAAPAGSGAAGGGGVSAGGSGGTSVITAGRSAVAGSAAAGSGGSAGMAGSGRGPDDVGDDAGVAPAAGSGGTAGGAGSAGTAGAPVTAPAPDERMIGWAAVSGDGVATTTGGQGGRTVSPASAAELLMFAESEEPLIIQLRGAYAVPRLNVLSNKTLIGMSGGATIEGGVRIRGRDDDFVRNVIIKNVRLNGATSDVDGDALQIHFAHHVWIDHCEIWDGPDGNLDVVHGSNWVTVSWTKFRYTENPPDADHRFSNLVGHSDNNADEDTGRLKVTWHHNHWVERIIERMPRVRFGEVHVFNNYYTSTGNNYAVGGGLQARLRVENNVFEGMSNPHVFYEGEPTAQIVASGNKYTNTTGDMHTGQGNSFMPAYPYELEDVATVAASVKAHAGPK